MPDTTCAPPSMYRVWIVQFRNWRPEQWDAVPPRFTVLEPGVADHLSPEAAAHWLQGFNADMLSAGKNLWAVAVAVQLRYEGDLVAGQTVGEDGPLAGHGSQRGQSVGEPMDLNRASAVQGGLLQADQGFCQSPQRSR